METTAIIEYKATEAAIAEIQRFKGLVVDVTNPSGMANGKSALREVAAVRIALEKTRKKLKEQVLERGRQIDGQARPLFERVAEIEDPIKTQIDAEEIRAERERQAAIEAEQTRLAAAERARKEVEEADLARQRAEIARQLAVIDAERKAREDEERGRRQALAAEESAARQRIEEQNRAAAAAREDEDRKARAARRAEEDRLRAEGERVAEERHKLEEAARAEQFAKDEAARAVRLEEQRKREAEENARAQAEREQTRKTAELLDARSMLETFRKRFGHRPEFVLVLEAIDECLEIA